VEKRKPCGLSQAFIFDGFSNTRRNHKSQILSFFSNEDKVTSSQLAKYTGLTQGRIRTILQELVSDGVITKVGDNRHTSHRLKGHDVK
jgi:predicted HTH transcriptional regulator